MTLKRIYQLVDGIAPFSLSDELCKTHGMYDNSGIILDCGGEITKILFALDLSHEAVKRAKEMGAELILTHHPAIYAPVKHLIAGGENGAIVECAKAGISVLSAHLNLDSAQGGIDECLMQGLGGTEAKTFVLPVSNGAYGRIYEREPLPLEEFQAQVQTEFQTRRLLVYGGGRVQKIASLCGAGLDEYSIAFAIANGADTIVSSDAKHHLITMAVEGGLNVVLLTHYASEIYGFTRFYQKIKEKIQLVCELFVDGRLL